MSTEFEREERYIVFKLSDVEEHFTPGEKQQLARLEEVQRVGREEAGKPLLRCVVVEKDWPEYEPTWKAIEARVTGAQPAPSLASDDVSFISEGKTQPAQSVKDDIIDDLQSQFDTEGITEHDSGDALIRLSDAIAAVEDNFTHPDPSIPEGWKEGVEDVAAMLRKKADDYADEYGYDDMGGLSFGVGMGGEAKMDYYNNLIGLIEEVQAMLAAAPEAKP